MAVCLIWRAAGSGQRVEAGGEQVEGDEGSGPGEGQRQGLLWAWGQAAPHLACSVPGLTGSRWGVGGEVGGGWTGTSVTLCAVCVYRVEATCVLTCIAEGGLRNCSCGYRPQWVGAMRSAWWHDGPPICLPSTTQSTN